MAANAMAGADIVFDEDRGGPRHPSNYLSLPVEIRSWSTSAVVETRPARPARDQAIAVAAARARRTKARYCRRTSPRVQALAALVAPGPQS